MSLSKTDLSSRKGDRGDAKGRKKAFLLLDILLLVAIVAAVFFLVLLLTPLNPFSGNKTESAEITYTVELVNVDGEVYDLLQVGDVVTDANTGKAIGKIVKVDKREYTEYIFDPVDSVRENDRYVMVKEAVENRYTVIVTLSVTAEYVAGEGYEVDRCRIAVGRDYELEFPRYAGGGKCVTLQGAEGEVS